MNPMFVLSLVIFMARRKNIESFGYEPNPSLARAQIKSLLPGLNRTRITTALAAQPNLERPIRLPLSKKQRELRRLVEAWQASGPNLQKLFTQYPELERRTKFGETIFLATKSGRGYLEWAPSPVGANRSSARRVVLEDFMTLIANPRWELLGGPCARCGDYFVKHTKRQKVYCSRNCGSAATAVPAMKRKRQEEQARRIRSAQESIAEFSKSKRRLGWKEWVSNETGFTIRWITRAVNRGAIRPPN
jgi:hypothetical protein